MYKHSKILSGSWRLHWTHWVVIALSLLLTFSAWFITSQQVQQKTKAQFDFQADQIIELVQERMAKYEEALWAGVALLHAMPNKTSRDDWRVFATRLKIESRFPGINGLGVIHYVSEASMPDYLNWQRESMPNYALHPKHNEGEYWPITYIEPLASNQKAVGLDMAHEKNRYNAAKKARDTGEANITGPITLVQDAKKTPGFLFYAPWYGDDRSPIHAVSQETTFLGLVYAQFIMHKLMDGALANTNRQVNFSIDDGEEALYSELNANSENYDSKPLFLEKIAVDMYGRHWVFTVQSSKLFREQHSQTQPIMILIGGIVIDALLFFIFILLSRANRRAVAYADKVTEDLKQSNQALMAAHSDIQMRNTELVEANKDLDQFAFVASHDLKAPLRGISQLAQWIEEDLKDSLTPQTSEFMTLLQGRVSRLDKLLDALLSYSRIGREKATFETFNLGGRATELFSFLSPDQTFEFRCDDEVGDITTVVVPLEIVLRNLIANAYKHHHKDAGIITFTAKVKDDHYVMTIEDNGPGIPQEHQQKIFELFRTLKPRDEVEGSGLGLSMVKKILERYGCEYQVVSDGKNGTTFCFDWPSEQQLKDMLSKQ
ncbi:sensor histidine kinase [Marinomonas profundimaris]|uniref:histidine kinase n=1 Tax=Marinomonas profundimaris TaxID=1208321 RepID=W1RTY4_9GAMM|nr:CHASE domain-containing protein [Marinomonas profundimaris]ETI60467.1 histidine kinase [Marinomonas profundimaris]